VALCVRNRLFHYPLRLRETCHKVEWKRRGKEEEEEENCFQPHTDGENQSLPGAQASNRKEQQKCEENKPLQNIEAQRREGTLEATKLQ
jgi:hypothetical protein